MSLAPLVLTAAHRLYVRGGALEYTCKGNKEKGFVYVLNDMVVLTKTILETEKSRKIKKEGYHPDKAGNHYVDTIKYQNLTLQVSEGSVNKFSLVCSSPPGSWEFVCENAISIKEWTSAIRDALDTFALNLELDDHIKSGVDSTKDFAILSASYGVLQNNKHRIDVTEKLRQIVTQQGGNQLILHPGSKEQLLGQPYTKKPLAKKKIQLHIMYSAKGSVKEVSFDEKDAVTLSAAC